LGDGDIVVATASGHILDFDAQTRALKRNIDYGASKVELSADGASVVAAPLYGNNMYSPVKNLRVYSLASGTGTVPASVCDALAITEHRRPGRLESRLLMAGRRRHRGRAQPAFGRSSAPASP
jgi:hypothetical protein